MTPSNEERAALVRALQSSQYPGAKAELVELVIDYCQAAGLDPLTKPVHIVPMRTKNSRGEYVWRDQIMPGIESYRTKAHRTGQYAGCGSVEYGPTITQEFTDHNSGAITTVRYPEWARITVRRRLVTGEIAEFTGEVWWAEAYVSAGRSDVPNSMWQKRPRGQLEKCAEAAALRKGFPEEVGGIPVREEMEGRIIEESPAPVPAPAPTAPGGRLAAAITQPPVEEEGDLGAAEALVTRLRETVTMPAEKARMVISEVRPLASAMTGAARELVLGVWTETIQALRERAVSETPPEPAAVPPPAETPPTEEAAA